MPAEPCSLGGDNQCQRHREGTEKGMLKFIDPNRGSFCGPKTLRACQERVCEYVTGNLNKETFES